MTRWLIVTGGGAALGAAGLIATYLAIRADLPPRVASHWGLDGVDATQDPAALVATLIAVNLGCLLLLGALAAVGPIEVRRPLAMTVAALTGVLMLGVGGTLWAQRGLADPYAATDATRLLALGFAAAAPLAGLAYWLLPTHIPTPRDPLSWGAGAPSAGEAEAGLSRGAGAAAGAFAGGAAARFELPSEPLVGDGPWIVPVPAGVSGYVIAGLLGVLALGLVTTPARWVACRRHTPSPARGGGCRGTAGGGRRTAGRAPDATERVHATGESIGCATGGIGCNPVTTATLNRCEGRTKCLALRCRVQRVRCQLRMGGHSAPRAGSGVQLSLIHISEPTRPY